MIKFYDSIPDLRAEWMQHKHFSGYEDASSFYGYEKWSQTIELSLTGDTRLVAEAERLISQIDSRVNTNKRVPESCVAGGWANVPAAIAGQPLTMRRMVHVQSEHAPIKIFVSVDSWASVPAELLTKRGCAVLALVMQLVQTRPVQLFTVCTIGTGKDSYVRGPMDNPEYDKGEVQLIAPINTAPLDLATACYALTSQGFARRLCYGVANKYGSIGNFTKRETHFGTAPAHEFYAKRIAPGSDDVLYLNPILRHSDWAHDSVTWVNAQLKRFGQLQEEEAYA